MLGLRACHSATDDMGRTKPHMKDPFTIPMLELKMLTAL